MHFKTSILYTKRGGGIFFIQKRWFQNVMPAILTCTRFKLYSVCPNSLYWLAMLWLISTNIILFDDIAVNIKCFLNLTWFTYLWCTTANSIHSNYQKTKLWTPLSHSTQITGRSNMYLINQRKLGSRERVNKQ